jgi:tight adherence protein C
MLEVLGAKLVDSQFLLTVLVAVAVAATLLTIAMPLLETDTLGKRMKSVATERDKIRQRERERLAQTNNKATLRSEPKAIVRQLVEQFDLKKWLGTEESKQKLAMAGFRGQKAETTFLFARAVMPVLLLVFSFIYIFFIIRLNYPTPAKLGICLFAAYVGIKFPEIFIKNTTQKRQQSMRRAFPDALDLLLICVESGMSIEHALRKVAHEIGSASIPLAEELHLTTAEMAFLPDRRQALENLSARTGLESVRQIVTVLVQAERYGTPLGQALRVVSQESRDNRMMEAEKKAAALPPKLTVPMIIFFLPVLFAVILTPAIVQISALWK